VLRRRIAAIFLALTGWRPSGSRPTARRCVVIAAPHTSNWDLLFMLAFAWHFEMRPCFMMKHTLFVGPAGWLFRRLGAIPVERHLRRGMVQQMCDHFEHRQDLVLVVPAEGTRSPAPHWKSGFYRIALAAKVPVVLSFLDYPRRTGGFGPVLAPSGDVRRDMDTLRAFYTDKVGRRPALAGPVRLAEEDELPGP
jgi:1-acyl-sn-glycerol-3-phosphate acyltransferase